MPNMKVVAEINEEVLSLSSEYSDRYVYSNYFMPLLIQLEDAKTPLLPFYIKQKLFEVVALGFINPERLKAVLRDLGYPELWNGNYLKEAETKFSEWERSVRASMEMRSRVTERGSKAETATAHAAAEATRLSEESMRTRSKKDPRPLKGTVRWPSVLGEQDVEFIAGLLRSEVGVLFLDRTRIRPVGLALGEHVYSLGLTPGEEITLEQKTFSKRQVTFEEQSEQEKQFDIELSSTLSTELQEGFERQKSRSDSWGLTWNAGAQYTSPMTQYGQVNANFGITETKNTNQAHQQAARHSVKDSETASSKVSARYRAQHKTTFRVVSEEGFEATSKRTIRNPNKTTPVTVHYFKVLQRLKLMQERYGVRLCWVPSVKDPASVFFDKIRKGRQHIIAEAERNLPPRPVEPQPPDAGGGQTSTSRQVVTRSSEIVHPVASDWLAWGMDKNFNVDINYDSGYTWDGDTNFIERSISVFTTRDPVNRWVVGIPIVNSDEGGNKLRVVVHIDTPSVAFGPDLSFQISANFYKDVTITQQSTQSTTYNDNLVAYRTALREWEDGRTTALAAAQKEADAYEKRLIEQLNPVNEMISQVIAQSFPQSVRDEIWEIDYWQRLFDWERASVLAYPGWWSGGETRNPVLDLSNFINASWARIYLPVKVGMEQMALRWIYAKSVAVPVAPQLEKQFDAIAADIKKFREDVLGAPDELAEFYQPCQEIEEKYRCLAAWYDLVPTDGTHVEVIQGTTNSADAITEKEITDAADLREALLESERLSADLKVKARNQMTEPAKIKVNVGSGSSSS